MNNNTSLSVMKLKKNPIFNFVAIVLGLIILLFIFRSYEVYSRVSEYDLSDLGKSKSDHRLALYWLYAKNDPVFAIPGTDLTKAKQNLILLDSLLSSTTYYYPPEQGKMIEETLYPTDFWYELLQLETYREDFINKPNRDKAEIYHQQLSKTITLYQEAMHKMTFAIDDLKIDNAIGFIAGTTSTSVIVKKLNAINEKVATLVDLENQRFECLNIGLKSCVDLNLHRSTIRPFADYHIRLATTTPEFLMNKDILDAVYTKDTSPSTLITLEESLCYPQGKPPIYAHFDEIHELLPGVTFIRATPVNDIWLQDLSKLSESAFYKHLSDSGLDYNIQPMNLYSCVDGGVEYQKLTTIKKIYELANTLPSSIETTQELPEDIARLLYLNPNQIEAEGILYEALIRDYVATLDNVFDTYTEKELLGYLGPENHETLRKISLIWRTKSADLDKLINTAAYLTVTNSTILEHIEIPLDPLYITRSYISLFFQLGNQTINQGDYSLISQINPQSLDSFLSVSANELFTDAAAKNKLKEMLITNRQKLDPTLKR